MTSHNRGYYKRSYNNEKENSPLSAHLRCTESMNAHLVQYAGKWGKIFFNQEVSTKIHWSEWRRWIGRCSMQSIEERKREVCPTLIHSPYILVLVNGTCHARARV
jgi:hypothetical protein